jgi:hypothetical protein
LKQYIDDSIQTPQSIALKDRQGFLVENIIRHKGSHNQKTKMMFLVKWLNYSEEENTWETWNTLKTNLSLHRYLIFKNLERLIPKSFVQNETSLEKEKGRGSVA